MTIPTCIIGVGASAGGFEPVRELLHGLPAGSGLAVVVVQHLDPHRKSLAPELFAKATALSVMEARDGMRVEADHVYTAPPDSDLSIHNGILHVKRPAKVHGMRLPIDHFFRALGEDQCQRAVGVILSGAGSDGAVGIQSIAARGGVVLAQEPASAQFKSMPQSALDTGLVNQVLPVERIAGVLLDYANHPYLADNLPEAHSSPDEANAFNTILDTLSRKHRLSLHGYKNDTLLRRIYRRMGLKHIRNISAYAAVLRDDAQESNALIHDLLIGVTEFFRDPAAWNALRVHVIRPLLEHKPASEPIRVWVPGVSTGEEAYTLAIVLLEELEKANKLCPLQIFATDANEAALDIGRRGVYPAGIAAKLSAKQLEQFFVERSDHNVYKVRQALRDAVVFGKQNVLADPPFSKQDLVSCRNLLIYLKPDQQQQAILRFHFALQPGGYLFLGAAESVGRPDHLFTILSEKWRLYQRIGATPRDQINLQTNPYAALPSAAVLHQQISPSRPPTAEGIATRLILEQFAPAAALVDERGEASYFCGPVERYISQPQGAATQNLLLLVREGLRSRIRSAMRTALTRAKVVTDVDARVKRDGHFEAVKLTVIPTSIEGEPHQRLLVVFHDQPAQPPALTGNTVQSGRVHQIEDELVITRADLQATIEQLETSYDELKIANEEAISMNEELQTSNEELESSKEEMQSLNEELSAVNQELEAKIAELEGANNDLKNVLASTDIATLCLDFEFRLKWFSPATDSIINLLPSDAGRPITDFASAVVGLPLIAAAKTVLATLERNEQELEGPGGRWYLRRILPYRVRDGSVDGVLVTFIDISDTRRLAQEAIMARDHNRELECRVKQRTREVREMARAVADRAEQERQALALDLHDDLAQSLALAQIKLNAAQSCASPSDQAATMKELSQLIEQANERVHSLSFQLSPPVLHLSGLLAALEELAKLMQQQHGLSVKVTDDGAPKPLEPIVASNLFRGVRELLINVVKHADSGERTHVDLRRVDDVVAISVRDWGKGFDPTTITCNRRSGGLGLASLRHRISLIDGNMSIHSMRDGGTEVTLTAPLLEERMTQ